VDLFVGNVQVRILLVHNRYQLSGGEDAVLEAESDLLVSQGNSIEIAETNNVEISGLITKVAAALDLVYSRLAVKQIGDRILSFRPEVIHIHNFFPLLTPSIYDACIEAGVPVVQTLHNYRSICPGALFMREGRICEKCVTYSPFYAVLHRCYRNSIPGSLAVARMVNYHRKRKTWQIKVDRFIALTEFAKRKFVEAGFPEGKIVVKPNFYFEAGKSLKEKGERKNTALFVGRLSQEKGVGTLLSAWLGLDVPLRIAGDGPLLESVKTINTAYVSLLGQLTPDQVSEEMSRSAFLVMPSECYEGFPMVLAEAFAHELPVVASRLGGMAEIVEDGVTGLHFEAGNAHDLVEKVRWMQEHPIACRQMGEKARRAYETKYTPGKNYEMLLEIYRQAIEEKRKVNGLRF